MEQALERSAFCFAHTVVVVLSDTGSVTWKPPAVSVRVVANAVPVQLEVLCRVTVAVGRAVPVTSGALLLAGDKGETDVSAGGSTGFVGAPWR